MATRKRPNTVAATTGMLAIGDDLTGQRVAEPVGGGMTSGISIRSRSATSPIVTHGMFGQEPQHQPPTLDAQTAPARTTAGGYVMIDHALAFDSIAIISGWMSEGIRIQPTACLGSETFPREDATVATGKKSLGFIFVLQIEGTNIGTEIPVEHQGFRYRVPIAFPSAKVDVALALRPLLPYVTPLLPHLVRSKELGQKLLQFLEALPLADRRYVNAHIDEARLFKDLGFVICGWAISTRNDNLWLVSPDGSWRSLRDAIRYDRPDIETAFDEDFGVNTAGAGFFCAIETALTGPGSPVKIIAATTSGWYVLYQMEGEEGTADPMSYARWAFSQPIPPSRFTERLERHDGKLIEQLIAQRRNLQSQDYEIWDTAKTSTVPDVSVIVPLYGRADFVEHQLLEFCNDPDFTSRRTELIYVVDDPKLLDGLRMSAPGLIRLYGVPFKLVASRINRGYSGANNLGSRVAKGKTLILLNSDVFTKGAGWSTEMARQLNADPTICAVGARLEYPDGSLQHLGMSFEYSDEWAVWLNKHPKSGVDIAAREALVQVLAATGACLAVRAADYAAVGGMDEGFLVGDFEDSDLCLKLKQNGGRIVVLCNTKHVHLERQSFRLLGEPGYRVCITRFNAWRHSRRWAATIENLKAEESV